MAKRRFYKIINGTLYDTSISTFVHPVDEKGHKTPRRNDWNSKAEFYICKNGSIFKVINPFGKGEVIIPSSEEIEQVKSEMKPELYKRYFDLVIPEKVKPSNYKEQSRLSRVE